MENKEQRKWHDMAFSANKRNTNNAVMALAKWLDVEYLTKLHDKAVEQEK